MEFSKKNPRNRNQNYINNAASRMYAGKGFDPENYAATLRQDDNMILPPPGEEIRQGKMIGDLDIPEGHQPIMIVELQEERWVYSMAEVHGSGSQKRCGYCQRVTGLDYACKCK